MGWEPLRGARQPVGLDDSLHRLRDLIGTARPDSLAVLGDNWEQVIGARLAAHCRLDSLRHGTLVVSSADGAVAEQLRWMAREVATAANALLGADEITAVEVRSTRDPAP